MALTDYYWSRVPGFGKMWFLMLARQAKSRTGGASLLGSVVHDHEDRPFGGMGIFGKNYPEPCHLTTPQIVLKAIQANRSALGIAPEEKIVQETPVPVGFKIEVTKEYCLKLDIGNFPSLPISFSIDYARMANVTLGFGAGTRQQFIPTGLLSRLHDFYRGDGAKVPASNAIDIGQETIVHQLLLAKQYSVTFESLDEFKTQFEANIAEKNLEYAGKLRFTLDPDNRKRVVATVNHGHDYLIALNDIDWNKL